MKYFKIKDEIYGMELLVIIGELNKAHDYLSKKFDIEIERKEGEGEGEFILNDNKPIIILNSYHKDNIKENAVLIHELFHYVMYNMRLHGIKLNFSSEEAFTYYMTFIYTKILENLYKLK